MMAEQQRHKRLLAGCLLAAAASAGLIVLAIVYGLAALDEMLVLPAVFFLTILMGCGATLTLFNIKRP